MARFQTSALINSIHGSVGGTTFQLCRSGLVVKSKPIKSNSFTARQSSVHSLLAVVRSSWAALTPTKHELWNSFASYAGIPIRHSKSVVMTGFECYVRCNYYRALYSLSLVSSPVFNLDQASMAFVNITSGGGNLNINLSSAPVLATMYLVAQISPILGPGATTSPLGYRMLVFATAAATNQDVKIGMDEAWGSFPIPGDQLRFRLYSCLHANGYRLTLWDGLITVA